MNSILRNAPGKLVPILNLKSLHGPRQLACLTTAANTNNLYETLNVSTPTPFVFHVELNRPKKLNSFSKQMWFDIHKCFSDLGENSECRVIVLSAAGRLFSAGLDLSSMSEFGEAVSEHDDIARKCQVLHKTIKLYQDSITSIEKCLKPVIAAVHNACVGAGVDLITATDIRLCSEDAFFQVKEVDIGMAADVGSLQRLPRIIRSDSLARELAYTARKLFAPEAKECGLVSNVYDTKESMISAAIQLASDIASKSPVAVQGTKRSLNFSRDHTVQEGLDDILTWNMVMLQSEDFINASIAQATKSPPPTFSKL